MLMKFFTNMKAAVLLVAALLCAGTAFAETGSETEQNATGGGSSNAQVDGQSYFVAGTYIAGKGSAKTGSMTSNGFKLRTGSDGKRAVFTVNQPYTIHSLTLTGASNYELNSADGKDVSVIKVEADGEEVEFTGGEAFKYRDLGESCTLTITGINAKESIAIYFDNGDSKGSQINASWAIEWSRPDATQPTITVTPDELTLIPGATYQLNAKVDPAKFTTHWETMGEDIATVSEIGLVTAVSAGFTTISNVWNDDASVYGATYVSVIDFDPADYKVDKAFDFTAMGDVTLTIESEAAANIWNEGNNKTNAVYYCTNEGLEDIAVQAVLSSNKGWSIVDGQGLTLGSGAGRCAAIGNLKGGQIVEIFYTGDHFYTGNREDAKRKDDGALKTSWNDGIGHAIYMMEEDGMLGFEIDKGKCVKKIVVYTASMMDADEITLDFEELLENQIAVTDGTSNYVMLGLPCNLDFTGIEGIKAYTATKNYDNYDAIISVTLLPISKVPAGTGILVKADEIKEYTIPIVEEAEPIKGENAFVAVDEDIDLFDAVKLNRWGEFVSGPAELTMGLYIKDFDYETLDPIYDFAFGFFPYPAPTSAGMGYIKAGSAYLNIEEGEWDAYGYGYVKLNFADNVATFNGIAELTSMDVINDMEGINATLQFAEPTTVTWTDGEYALIEDNTAGLLVMLPEDVTVKAGDQLKGSFTASYLNYMFPQLLASGASDASTIEVVTGGEAPEGKKLGALAEAYEDANVMRLVKLNNVILKVNKGTWSSDYYLSDADGAEVYLNDAFQVCESALKNIPNGAVISELTGFAFIIGEGSILLQYGYDAYQFIPVAMGSITTGISELAAGKQEATIYNMQGVRVNNMQKGLYIVNGKKVVVK